MDNSALVNEFLVESFENLSSINSDLTQIEREPENKELLNSLYRTVHTMKGSASFLGFKKLMDITHSAENLLDELREDKFKVNSNIIDALLETFDICNALLGEIEKAGSEGDLDIQKNRGLLEELLKLQGEVFVEIETQNWPEEESAEEEVLDDELSSLLSDHRSHSSPTLENSQPQNVLSQEVEGISAAALESMKELIADGKIDSSLLSDLSGEIHTIQVESAPEVHEEVKDETKNISEAALESIKELVASGKVGASVLGDLDLSGIPQGSKSLDGIEELKESVKPSIDQMEASPSKENVINIEKREEVESQSQSGNEEGRKSIADSFVRVNVKVLDKIMNIVGELVLNRNQIVQFSNVKSEHELTRLSQQLNVITSELQSEVMSTRMQPVGSILTKFERLVRDFSRQSGKKISLQLFGQETELDKTLIEAIKDPLVHIIRNACDHGLETIAEREKAGKSPEGIITIKSYNESGQVTIEIVDNGRGLNPEKIGAKAIEKGIIDQEQLGKMSDSQIFGLIFAPGFSTAEKITNISGRGVGMDVVKTNIEKIGGSVNVTSELGVGTIFKLRIPLTLAIVPALVIKSHGESFAIPQLNLNELVRLETEVDKSALEIIQGSEFLKLRGALTPVFRLSEILNLKTVHERNEKLKEVVIHSRLGDGKIGDIEKTSTLFKDEEAYNIVIMTAENQSFGIIVDEILDTEEIVVKPLDNSLKHISMFGGATIMGDGQVALILDAVGFLNTVCVARSAAVDSEVAHSLEIVEKDEHLDKHESLLFKLGDDREYALPLSLVSRLEEFDVTRIEKTGDQPIVRYMDLPMPLINLEKCLNLNSKSSLEIYKSEHFKTISCIVTNVRGKHYGLVVKEVLDISMDDATIDDSAVDRDGILGTVFINDRTISLLDMYAIVEAQHLGKKHVQKQTLKVVKNKNYASMDILVVDDSPMYRKMIHDLMLELGFTVDVANNGSEALEFVKKKDYDLVITDIEMPVLTGYEFAEKVRTELKKHDLTILALSTRFSDEDQQKGRDAGFNYHMEKFKKDEIIEKIEEILTGK